MNEKAERLHALANRLENAMDKIRKAEPDTTKETKVSEYENMTKEEK